MTQQFLRKPLMIAGAFFLLWLAAKYVLPLLLPFLAGGALALAAEPLVSMAQRRLKLQRGGAAGVGVSVMLVFLAAVVALLGALVVKELMVLAQAAPDLGKTAQKGMGVLRDWLLGVVQKTPKGLQPMLTNSVQSFFGSGTQLMQRVTERVPAVAGVVISWVPDGVLGLGTAILSGYMISARLPKIRQWLKEKLPQNPVGRYLPVLRRVRRALGGWLKAQGKLALVTYSIVALGFTLLRIPYGWGWALLVAAVDAVPVLGTGTVLVPWALVSFLQADPFRAIGLLAIYGVAMVTRTALEPRLVGRHLDLDPLLTLLALYFGYKFWGILGMLLAPVIITAAKSIAESKEM